MTEKLLAAAKRLRWRMLKPVLEKTGAIEMVFRGWERRAARTPGGDFDDALPMPPPDLMVAVAGTPNREWFSTSGRRDADLFKGHAARHGVPLADQRVVVDLGCGCGRIARWLAPEVVGGQGRFLGFDINPGMAGWCDANLPGDYGRNQLLPPLAVPDGTSDIVYAYSVLTHLREATAVLWLEEIARVLRPGGLALLTFHDETYAEICAPAEVRAALTTQPYVVLNDALEGSNYISAWTTREHFSRLAGPLFEPLEILPGRADFSQALAVLRRRP
jgi:SAM-dependent methyltransferase